MPVIRTTFNQAVSKDSVEQHVYMVLDSQNKHYPIKAEHDPRDHQKSRIVPLVGEGYYLDFGATKPDK